MPKCPMAFDDIKDWAFKLFNKLSKKDLLTVVKAMRNHIDEKEQDVAKLKDEVQKLKDQINKLKGEKGKPDIKPPKDDDKDDDKKGKSGQEKGGSDKPKNNRNGSKKDQVKVNRTVEAKIDKSILPADALYKGKRNWWIRR